MSIKSRIMKHVIVLLAIILFSLGIYVYSNQTIRIENFEEPLQSRSKVSAKCPNVLVKRGEHLYLYNTTDRFQIHRVPEMNKDSRRQLPSGHRRRLDRARPVPLVILDTRPSRANPSTRRTRPTRRRLRTGRRQRPRTTRSPGSSCRSCRGCSARSSQRSSLWFSPARPAGRSSPATAG